MQSSQFVCQTLSQAVVSLQKYELEIPTVTETPVGFKLLFLYTECVLAKHFAVTP